MDIRMFVMAHKQCEIPRIEGCFSLLVGAQSKALKGFDCRDDSGDNISGKNANYCELTGIYWIRHNVDCDVVGTCHYRRFFTKSPLSGDPKHFLNADDIEKLLSKYDIILPMRSYYPGNIRDVVKVAPNRQDLVEMEEAIAALCPDYLDAYRRYLGQNGTYLLNMFVMRQADFQRYCDWLFPILGYIEARHDLSGESDYRKRLFGFLSERLLNVWVDKNFPPDRIKECRVVNTEMSPLLSLRKDTYNVVKKFIHRG